ncbi:hypothetical protein F5I97DRAFT_2023188 [Phlebopus sp. FC_14]|nr:hypothetical protein F5I97DRAFT_2023188 [Phlebopus sp. FC_14]
MSTADSIAFFQSRSHIVRDIRNQCVASFTCMLWDSLQMLGDEVEYIWVMPWKLKAKWIYLYLRYVNLVGHLAYLLIVSRLTSGYAPEQTCRAWLALASTTTLLSHMSVELILALRVYALFGQKTRIAVLLCILMGSEVIGTISSFTVNNISDSLQLGTVCVLVSLPKQTLLYRCELQIAAMSGLRYELYSRAPALFSHTTIVGLILFRSRIYGWGRTPIVSLIIREGIVVYISMIALKALFALVLIGSLLGNERVFAVTFWAMSILSACGCRLVISLQKLGGHDDDETQPLTSNIELESYPS